MLPACSPGSTQTKTREAVIMHLDEQYFPADTPSGLWAETVQPDLKATGDSYPRPLSAMASG